MRPEETGSHYDRIAHWWMEKHTDSTYGMAALERAIRFTQIRSAALDVGCGSSGRFIDGFVREGFAASGVDVSKEMIALAEKRNPQAIFYAADICTWQLPQTYDLITAWDSTFHLPVGEQEPVLKKMCAGLNSQGVLLFTCGGGSRSGEISGGFQGETFEYSTLGVDAFLRRVAEAGCGCKHVEYDQYPDNHVYIIAQKD